MLYGGDAYFLTLEVGEYEVRLTKIVHANNQNVVGEISRFLRPRPHVPSGDHPTDPSEA